MCGKILRIPMRDAIERLKKRYNIASNTQLSVIVGTFSIAGMTDSLTVRSLLNSPVIMPHKMPIGFYV